MSSNAFNPDHGANTEHQSMFGASDNASSLNRDLTGQPVKKASVSHESLGSIDSELDNRLFSLDSTHDDISLHIQPHRYGDEFKSGISPIDHAVQFTGRGLNQLDKAIETGTQAVGEVINHSAKDFSERINHSKDSIQQNWGTQDNEVIRALKKWGNQASNLFGRQIANASTHPNVQAFMDGTGAVWKNVVGSTVQSAQATTQNLLDGVYGESYFEKSQSLALPILNEYQEIQKQDNKATEPQSTLVESLNLLNQQKNKNDEPALERLKKRQENLDEQLNSTQHHLEQALYNYHQELVHQSESLTPKSILQNKIDEYTSEDDRRALQSLIQLDIPDIKAVDKLIVQHKGLLEKYKNNVEYVVKTYDLPDGGKAQSTPIPLNPLAQHIPEQELIIATLEATRESFIRKNDELSTAISPKKDLVEDLELKLKQLDKDKTSNDRELNSAQTAVSKDAKDIAQVEGELKTLQNQKNSTQQELQDFLDRYGHFLPEAELQVAIAERLQYVQAQFDKTVDLKERVSLQEQLDWLKLKQAFAVDHSNPSLKEEWDGLIVELKGRKNDLEKSGKQTLPLQQYIQFLTDIDSNKVYVPEEIGGLRDRSAALSKNQTELESILSDIGSTHKRLTAVPQAQMTQENLALLQQSEKELRLFQRVDVALKYEANQLDTWIKFLDRIDTPTQDRQRLDIAWQKAEATWEAVANFIQMRQGFVLSQGDTNVLKSFINEGVKHLQELSPISDLSNQLKSLIDFGLLASEIQPDFFKTRVTPQVNGFIGDLQNWNQSLNNISQTLTQLVRAIQPTPAFGTELTRFIQGQLKQIAVVQTQIYSNLKELQTALSESEQPLSMLQQQQQLDQATQLKQNEQQTSWQNEQQTITQKIQSGSLTADDLKQYLGQLLQDSASSLKDGHGFGEELLRSRESQANHFEQSSSLIRNELLGVYGDRELTQANLRDSITTVGTLKEVYFGLAQAVDKFKDEIGALQLDVKQGKELQQQFGDLQKRYIDSAQTLGDEVDNLFSSIETGSNQANSKVDEIEQKIRGLYQTANDADRDAGDLEGDAQQDKLHSQRERRRITLIEFNSNQNPEEYRFGRNPEVDLNSSDAILYKYVEDPNLNWENSGFVWRPEIVGFARNGVVGQQHEDGYWKAWELKIGAANGFRTQAKSDREQAAKLEQSEELKHWRDLKTQWEVVTRVGNDSKNSIKEIQRLLTVDAPTAQEEAAKASERLQKIQGLLPTLNQRLELAKGELQSSQAKLDADWSAYSTSADLHLQTMHKALNSYTQWESGNLEYQSRLDGIEVWSEQQGNTVAQKTALIQTLRKSLQEQSTTVESQLSKLDGDDRDILEHQKAALQQSLKLVDNVSNVFELQKGSLKNLQQLEESHESISVTEQQLMRDYVSNPDSDGQVLEKKLELARQTLAETGRLAEQAEDSSKTLDTFALDFKNLSLEAQNEYIQATQQLQPVLDDLKDAVAVSTQAALNLKDAQKKLISSSSEIKQALNEAIAGGDQEAAAFRDVANYQGMETAAQLYARDFGDLTQILHQCQ